jgi:hypothetical protein
MAGRASLLVVASRDCLLLRQRRQAWIAVRRMGMNDPAGNVYTRFGLPSLRSVKAA